MQRIRIKYRKGSEIRFISHLNLMKVFERAIRRANLPIAYSQGFNPHMRISYGPPLKLGKVSECELADTYIDSEISPEALKEKLNLALPAGIEILEAGTVDLKAPSICSLLTPI